MTLASVLQSLTLTVNGLLIGAGQTVRVQEIRGLDDLPEVRTFDSARSNVNGMDFGTDLLGGRVVEVDCISRPLDPAATLQLLRQALLPGDGLMVVSGLPGLPTVQLSGRVRRRKLPTNMDLALGVLRPTFDFETQDPRLYDSTETVLTTGPGSVSGSGLTPPLTPPLTPGGSSVGGHVLAANSGLVNTSPVFRVDGPVPGFSLYNSTTRKRWTTSLTVATGDWLEVDMDARTVLLNGTASRRAQMSGVWWDLPPGTSDVYYQPAGSASGSLMTLRFRSAY